MKFFICLLTIGVYVILLAETIRVSASPTLVPSSVQDNNSSYASNTIILDITHSLTVQSTLNAYNHTFTIQPSINDHIANSSFSSYQSAVSTNTMSSTTSTNLLIPTSVFTSYSFQHSVATSFSIVLESNTSLNSSGIVQETTYSYEMSSSPELLVTTMIEVTQTTVLGDTTSRFITDAVYSSAGGDFMSTEQPNCTENCSPGKKIVPERKKGSKAVIIILVILVIIIIFVVGIFCFRKKRYRCCYKLKLRSVSYRRFTDDDNEEAYLQLD